MTAAVPLPAAHPLTVGEFARLDEDEHGRWELMEGNLVMSPSPPPDHNAAVLLIAMQIATQLSGLRRSFRTSTSTWSWHLRTGQDSRGGLTSSSWSGAHGHGYGRKAGCCGQLRCWS